MTRSWRRRALKTDRLLPPPNWPPSPSNSGLPAIANFDGDAALLISVLVHEPSLHIAALAVAFACTLAFTAPFWSIPRTFLTGDAAAGGIGAISALGVLGGFVSPPFIGYVKDHTGDFRIGLSAVAVLAMVFAAALFLRRPRAPLPGIQS